MCQKAAKLFAGAQALEELFETNEKPRSGVDFLSDNREKTVYNECQFR
jgi:hypothetical protein